LNNAAIAAQFLRDRGADRIAILDVDFHHGNGTQDIFYDRSDVLYVSLHGDPAHAFPYFSGYADETGQAAGRGWNLNMVLAPATGDRGFVAAVELCGGFLAEHFPAQGAHHNGLSDRLLEI